MITRSIKNAESLITIGFFLESNTIGRVIYTAVLLKGTWPPDRELIKLADGMFNAPFGGLVESTIYNVLKRVHVHTS